MPWKTETPMEQKHRFVALAESGHFTVSELCRELGISRKTGHKWLTRYRQQGTAGLEEKSRAPNRVPGKIEQEIERIIVSERRAHPRWGPKKIRQRLICRHGIKGPPSVSTIGAVLYRNGMVTPRRRRGGVFTVERGTLTSAQRPNHVWAVDFKGWFLLGNQQRCDPLTISDLYSRYVLRVEGLPQATTQWTQKSFKAAFRRYGLPEIIRVDNGAPFASMGPGGLSRLSVWWIGLGIDVEFTRPGCPQDKGCHERMHRTLKADCCQKPSINGAAQQQRFDRWRHEFNHERPHEMLGMQMPCECYQASNVRLNQRIKHRLYEVGDEIKRVSSSGFISLFGKNCFVGEAFAERDVALERDDKTGVIGVRYANVKLGDLADSPNARLQPTASAERWGNRACTKKQP